MHRRAPPAVIHALIPDVLPQTWLRDSSPFGNYNNLNDLEFLKSIVSALSVRPEDPRYVLASRVLNAHLERQRIASVQGFVAYNFPMHWTHLIGYISSGDGEKAADLLRTMLSVLSDKTLSQIACAQMTTSGGNNNSINTTTPYNKAVFQRDLRQSLLQHCPDAASFLDFLQRCRKLTAPVLAGDRAPLEMSPQLFEAVLSSGNVPLLLDMLKCETKFGDKGWLLGDTLIQSTVVPPTLAVVRAAHSTLELLEEVIHWSVVYERDIDECDVVNGATALGTAVEMRRWDFVHVLLATSKVVSMTVKGRKVTFLAEQLSACQSVADTTVGQQFFTHARSVFDVNAAGVLLKLFLVVCLIIFLYIFHSFLQVYGRTSMPLHLMVLPLC